MAYFEVTRLESWLYARRVLLWFSVGIYKAYDTRTTTTDLFYILANSILSPIKDTTVYKYTYPLENIYRLSTGFEEVRSYDAIKVLRNT